MRLYILTCTGITCRVVDIRETGMMRVYYDYNLMVKLDN